MYNVLGNMRKIAFASAIVGMSVGIAVPAIAADTPVFKLAIENHRFVPETIEVPADTRVKLIVENKDATPEEFESYELNREVIISGNSSATVYVGPLDPGSYPFFGEFNPKTAQGTLIAK